MKLNDIVKTIYSYIDEEQKITITLQEGEYLATTNVNGQGNIGASRHSVGEAIAVLLFLLTETSCETIEPEEQLINEELTLTVVRILDCAKEVAIGYNPDYGPSQQFTATAYTTINNNHHIRVGDSVAVAVKALKNKLEYLNYIS